MGKKSDKRSLTALTSFRLGGRPLHYAQPTGEEDLTEAIEFCRSRDLPFCVLGGGSNLLAEDGELPFAVIHICSPGFNWIASEGECRIRVGAGVSVARLIAHCRASGLGGLEFLAGVPGTVGGAVAGNAGAWGMSISSLLGRAWHFDTGGSKHETRLNAGDFAYRASPFRDAVITEVELTLERRQPELIEKRVRSYLKMKAERHPVRERSAGCVFCNPSGQSAGKLLDLAGLNGETVGGAAVSELHATFIVNRGGTAQDVLELIEKMRTRVREKFGVTLDLEIQHWGRDQKVA